MRYSDSSMRKSDILIVGLFATTLICFSGCALSRTNPRYSMTQATIPQPNARQSMTQTSAQLMPPQIRREKSAGVAETTETDFSRRLHGGILLRFESGLIIVKPTDLPASSAHRSYDRCHNHLFLKVKNRGPIATSDAKF